MSVHTYPEDPGPGGYDLGYRQCPCFWGRRPGRLVRWLAENADLTGAHVLDLGCGEGKNAAYLTKLGCNVEAWDISAAALRNAKAAWPDARIEWVCVNVELAIAAERRSFDVVIAYGLLHCLPQASILPTITHMQRITKKQGFNIIVCYNDRIQDFGRAHYGFHPAFLPHQTYRNAYQTWEIARCSDENLCEKHPTDNIIHTHSMTRLLACRRTDDANHPPRP